MIVFTEREPFVNYKAFGPTKQKLIPVYMTKDGLEYFVANIAIEGGNYGPEYHRQEMERYKTQLIQNGGRYFRFNGQYDNPGEMLAEIKESGHTFTKPFVDLFNESPAGQYGEGFVSFWGNRNEVSAVFHYRIYDREFAASLREQVQSIIETKKGKKRRSRNEQ